MILKHVDDQISTELSNITDDTNLPTSNHEAKANVLTTEDSEAKQVDGLVGNQFQKQKSNELSRNQEKNSVTHFEQLGIYIFYFGLTESLSII